MMFLLHSAELLMALAIVCATVGFFRTRRENHTSYVVAAAVACTILAFLFWINSNVREYVNANGTLVYENKFTGIRGYYYPHDRWHQWPMWEESLNRPAH